jgi:hypothetical protein
MPLVATARSQAPSSCIKSTDDGVPRFEPVRSSIVTLLSQIGSAEDLLFTFILVWLACTLSFILGLPSLGSSVAFSAATSIATIGLYISYGTQFQPPKCPFPLHESSYHSQEFPSPSVSSTRIDLYEDHFTSASSRTQSQSPLFSGSPLYRLSFASQSSTRSTRKRSTTRPSLSGSSFHTPSGSGL